MAAMAGSDAVLIVPIPMLREVRHAAANDLLKYRNRMNKEKDVVRMHSHMRKVAHLKAFLELVEAQVGDIKYRGPERRGR